MMASEMMLPSEGVTKKQEISDIPVLERTYLTKKEISMCLSSLGARDIAVFHNDPVSPQWDAHRILVTASSNAQLRIFATALVRQLRRRNLQNYGVIGAEQGYEGSDANDETWFVVDCGNYVVHLLDDKTRKALRLEDLWTGRDRLARVNWMDEESVEAYVEANPVPDDYGSPRSAFEDTIKQIEKSRYAVKHRPVVKKKKTPKKRR
jgi:ribosomal silencing factor RsfS